ncbi:phage protease [Acinetobacter gerneri]|uniref:phage protease n=1 Tax=Acinetobacter gerneri TaxID=202952 RepID=UPI00293597B8|nr:phage protease [Acinetobacter gerneri]MDV2438698.1 phage protease [Acinetobacter gerneri]
MKNLLAALCAFDINLSADKLVLIPEGIFKGIDGRPFDAPHWRLTPENGRIIAAQLNARTIDMLIDYEHAIIAAKESGKPAPASGWLRSGGFEYVDGIGLCSNNWTWTKTANDYIEAEEYKYLSPFILYDSTGDVLGLINVTLTNTPNIDSLPPAKIAAAAQDFLSKNHEDLTMNEFLKLMLKKLGLAETATEQEVLAAANSAFTKFDGAFGTSLAADQTIIAATDKAIEVKTAANSAAPDPSKFVPIAMYNEAKAQAAKVASNGQAKERDDLIAAACADGRITGEAAIAWSKEFAERDYEGFKAHLAGIPKIAALSQTQTSVTDLNKAPNQQQFTPEDLAIAGMMGVDLGAKA